MPELVFVRASEDKRFLGMSAIWGCNWLNSQPKAGDDIEFSMALQPIFEENDEASTDRARHHTQMILPMIFFCFDSL